jgi:hypothetical protein
MRSNDNVIEPILKPMQNNMTPKVENNSSSLKNNLILGSISVVVVLLGVYAGYLLSGVGNKETSSKTSTSANTILVNKNEAGIADESKFSTTTDGVLEEGGIQGEGTYHLVRGSGPSQYAYLTSSSVDLSTFVGKKVQIWGETMSGKKAGWLIDVGKIKVMEGE